jgi:hypothetical protein
MKHYIEPQIIASELTQRKADLLIQNLFNLQGLDCFKLTGAKFNDTDYRYDVYNKKGKITNAQQVFIYGFIAGLNSLL